MPSLTLLDATHGFVANDLLTDGYFAMIPAYQSVWFADGRANGYHQLDMVDTKLTGTPSAAFTEGEVVTQATSDAQGIYITNPDRKLTGTVAVANFTAGESVTQAVSLAKGWVVAAAVVGATTLYIYPYSGTFVTSQIVTGASSGATITPSAVGPGQYHLVYRTNTTEFNATNVVTGADSASTMTPSAVLAPPHWIPWTTKAGYEGLPESGANAGCLCFGRIFLNSIANANQWYASRLGDPRDWLVSQNDLGTAVSSQTSKAGLVSSELVGFIPYQDHYLLFGCTDSIWVLRSDPAAGGVLTRLTSETGLASPTGFCWDDRDNLFILGFDGIYYVPQSGIVNAQSPVNVTKIKMPQLMRDIAFNRRTDHVSMYYDKDRYGLMIAITQKDGAWAVNFWVDLRTGNVAEEGLNIFPEEYAADHRQHSLYYYQSQLASNRALLLGCDDGYIRKFDDTAKTDDATDLETIASHFLVGPFAAETKRGTLIHNETSVELSSDSDQVDVKYYSADTAEEVVDNVIAGASPRISKTLAEDNLNKSIREKIKGGAIAVKISNDTNAKTYAIERMDIDIREAGRIK